MKHKTSPRQWFVQWLTYRFNPDLQEIPDSYNPAVGVITAAGVSAVTVAILYQLTIVNAFGVFQPLMQMIGSILVPGSQGITPASGYLGEIAGIFSSYFLVFVLWWVAGFRLPFVTLDRLPLFVAVVYAAHAVLAWQLFFPWLPLK
ncbi:hypothetical protein ACQ4M3_13295 [Leptolyngbya sp. AN03gr2]|uniref:hypothetical protein n=1 Tax=unclassified Leptolyngbya TaxID=2650499 RepID=UPI003D3178B4